MTHSVPKTSSCGPELITNLHKFLDMMSQGNMCCLCAEMCQDYTGLCDESGNPNEVQQLMSQYFDENLLHMLTGSKSTIMCMKCWHTISDFNSFQKSIYRTQRILRMKVEEIDIKSEEEFLPEDHIANSNCEQPTDWNILAEEEATLPRCDKEITHASSADDNSNTDDNVDNPVGVFIGGEFANESNSSELVEMELVTEFNEASRIKNRLTKSIPQNTRMSVKASDDVIAQWTPGLKCLFCTETCSTFSLLKRHFHDKHRPLKCQVKCCSRYYYHRWQFEDHIRLHIDSNAFACSFCVTKKTCRNSLAKHIRKHHPVPIDSNTLSSSSATATEISTKSIPKNIGEWKSSRTKYIKESDDFIAQMKPTLNCYLCPDKYTKFPLFRQHFWEIHPGKTFYIKCCKRKLTSRSLILEHLQHHANSDAFKCKLCELRCKTQVGLKRHMRKRHTTAIKRENKPAKIHEKSDDLLSQWLPSRKCVVCKETFTTLAKLQCHFVECHPSEVFYVECCERKLMTRSKIVAHVQYHVKSTDFKCDLCCTSYSHKRGLRLHMGSAH